VTYLRPEDTLMLVQCSKDIRDSVAHLICRSVHLRKRNYERTLFFYSNDCCRVGDEVWYETQGKPGKRKGTFVRVKKGYIAVIDDPTRKKSKPERSWSSLKRLRHFAGDIAVHCTVHRAYNGGRGGYITSFRCPSCYCCHENRMGVSVAEPGCTKLREGRFHLCYKSPPL
jgi:hypothetical protein